MSRAVWAGGIHKCISAVDGRPPSLERSGNGKHVVPTASNPLTLSTFSAASAAVPNHAIRIWQWEAARIVKRDNEFPDWVTECEFTGLASSCCLYYLSSRLPGTPSVLELDALTPANYDTKV